MDRWEYITEKFETGGFMGGILNTEEFEYGLNKLGEQGWELVSCIATHQGSGQSREVIAVFKRRIH